MIPALALILSFQLVGEVVSRALSLPLPGPVLGLVLLVICGSIWPKMIEFLREAANGLLANLSLFFVPAGVGIVAHLGQFRANSLAFAVALIVSTALAIAVGAVVFNLVAKWTGNTDD